MAVGHTTMCVSAGLQATRDLRRTVTDNTIRVDYVRPPVNLEEPVLGSDVEEFSIMSAQSEAIAAPPCEHIARSRPTLVLLGGFAVGAGASAIFALLLAGIAV